MNFCAICILCYPIISDIISISNEREVELKCLLDVENFIVLKQKEDIIKENRQSIFRYFGENNISYPLIVTINEYGYSIKTKEDMIKKSRIQSKKMARNA